MTLTRHKAGGYARFDKAHLVDGLFVPGRGRPFEPTAIKIQHGWSERDQASNLIEGTLEIRCWRQLTTWHQSLLLAAVAHTGTRGIKIAGSATDLDAAPGLSLYEALDPGFAEAKETAYVETTAHALLLDAGRRYASGTDYDQMIEALKDLDAVAVYRTNWIEIRKLIHDQIQRRQKNWRAAG